MGKEILKFDIIGPEKSKFCHHETPTFEICRYWKSISI